MQHSVIGHSVRPTSHAKGRHFDIGENNMLFGTKAACLAALLLQTKAHEVVKPGALRKGAGGNNDVLSSKDPNEGRGAFKEDYDLKSDQVDFCVANNGSCQYNFDITGLPCCNPNAKCKVTSPIGVGPTCQCQDGYQDVDGACSSCQWLGLECTDDACCPDLTCSISDQKCCSKQLSESCREDEECCGHSKCSGGTCCKSLGASCTHNEDCCGRDLCLYEMTGNTCCITREEISPFARCP
ncbi:hypothetical protein ACHAWF_013359 [Thalassiosira exigua]